jgi:parallel beta-helix repeat protein
MMVALCGGPVLAALTPAPLFTLHVSPQGNDTWTGKKPQPGGPDGPLATVTRALEIARQQRGTHTKGFNIIMQDGVYYLPQTITFTPADSGEASCPTRLQAAPRAKPRLVAGRRLTGWQPWREGILRCDLKPLGLAGQQFRQLFCNGQRQIMARHPNLDPADPHGGPWLYVEAAVEKDSKRHFQYAAGDLPDWPQTAGLEVFLFHSYNYYNTIVPVADIDRARRVITCGTDTFNVIKGEGAERYTLQNVLAALDAPGEWYLDSQESVVYFYPPAGVRDPVVEVPTLLNAIRLTPDTRHVTIQGLNVEISEGSAIHLEGARHCRVQGCTVAHTGVSLEIGGWGPWEDQCGIGIFGGEQNGAVGNDIYDTGGHGIKLTGGDRKTLTPAGNYAENNHIHHTGVYWTQGCGARVEGVGNRFSRNTVHDIPRFAVIFGGQDNVIEYNHLYDLNLQTCDTGAIYTGGRDWLTPWGSTIQYNYIHDIGGYGRKDGKWVTPEFSWGIYLDDNSNGCNVIGNIVLDGYWGGIHLHNAHDSLVENNIFVNGVMQQVHMNGWVKGSGSHAGSLANWQKIWEEYRQYPAWRKYPGFVETNPADLTPMSNNRFQRNIFYYQGETAGLYAFRSLPLELTTFDRNLVWSFDQPLRLGLQKIMQVEVAPGAAELIKHGGFEEGEVGAMPAGWTWMSRPEQAQAQLTEETARSGKRSLRVEATTGQEPNGSPKLTFVRTQEFAVQAGRAYKLSVWAKGAQDGLPLGLVAQSYKAQQHHWAAERSHTLTTDWREYVLDFYIPGPKDADYKPTLDNLWIRLDFRQAGGVYLVDDVSLKVGSNPLETKSEWQVWQDKGQDVHSLIADPQFVAPEQGDFRLKATSPALKLGFQPIPVEKIGCYRSPERATWPLVGTRKLGEKKRQE